MDATAPSRGRSSTRALDLALRFLGAGPVVILVILCVVIALAQPVFLSTVNLQNVLLQSSVVAMLAIGSLVVILTGGIDLSVGSTVAISGALACLHISESADPGSLATVLTAAGIALGTAVLLGAVNGLLVAKVGVQPIIATLILMVAGRGVAQLITDGQIITVTSDPYKMIGGGYWLTMPFAILLSALVVLATVLLTRSTALGLLLESVGGNPVASRLVGIRAMRLVALVYVFSALCAALAGLMVSSNVSAADGNNAGLWIELDAILAVVLGGTSLNGGRFSIGGTVLGALIIQTLSTTVYTIGIPPETTLVFKAFVVIAGSFLGYLTAGMVHDRIGRRTTFALFASLAGTALVLYFLVPEGSNTTLLFVGFPLGFFASGCFSGFGSYLAELYPTRARGTGSGFCYNVGRAFGALFPGIIGFLAAAIGLGGAVAFGVFGYVLAIAALRFLPETHGKELVPVE